MMSASYLDYFSLKETPFSIAPNPHYLYMSERHQEALAHLTYGFGESGGFVLLTGEVGTGKTTVSRCLLNQLPDNTQAAFILNPTLSAYELLATVADELGIDYQQGASLKDLTDVIMVHLLSNHQQGMHTLLVIDEAQHLQAKVLEQLRLLTNLETDSKKLLQVILIGQPELQQLLKRQDLRQLAQRITARYHLLPLTETETRRYIEHRLAVAGGSRPIFADPALKHIHRISGGIPRIINLLCDKALLGAYALHQTHVDKRLVNKAAKEALDRDTDTISLWQNPWLQRLAFSFMLLIPAVSAAIYADRQHMQVDLAIIEQQQQLQISKENIAAAEKQWVSASEVNQAVDLQSAFSALFSAWHVNLPEQDVNACDSALALNLECYWFNGSLPQLLAMQQTAILVLTHQSGERYYALYEPSQQPANYNSALVNNAVNDLAHHGKIQADDAEIVLTIGSEQRRLTIDFVKRHFKQQAVMLWQPPEDYLGVVDDQASGQLVQWLEQKLARAQRRSARAIIAVDELLLNQFNQFKHQVGDMPLSDTQAIIALTNIGRNTAQGGR